MGKVNEKTAVLSLETFQASRLPELIGKKQSLEKLVKENPIIEITDTATYEVMKKSRTTVRTGRTSLEKESKDVAARIKSVILDPVKSEYDSLIGYVKKAEDERQSVVESYENKKEEERKERQRIEEERIATAKAKINEFYDAHNSAIDLMLFESIAVTTEILEKAIAEFDLPSVAEFAPLFEMKADALNTKLAERTEILNVAEANRLEQVRLEAVRKENERLDLIEAGRRAQITQYANYMLDATVQHYLTSLETNFRDFTDDQFIGLVSRLETAKTSAEAEQKRKDAEAAELKAEQEKLAADRLAFRTEKRIKELTDLGFEYYEGNDVYVVAENPNFTASISKNSVETLDVIEYEIFIAEYKRDLENSKIVVEDELPELTDLNYEGSDPIPVEEIPVMEVEHEESVIINEITEIPLNEWDRALTGLLELSISKKETESFKKAIFFLRSKYYAPEIISF